VSVENVAEELDAAGEFFFNESSRTLFLIPPGPPGSPPPPDNALIALGPGSKVLVNVSGTQAAPVEGVALDGLGCQPRRRTDEHLPGHLPEGQRRSIPVVEQRIGFGAVRDDNEGRVVEPAGLRFGRAPPRQQFASHDAGKRIEQELGMTVVPFTWPVGMGKQFHGVMDLRQQRMRGFRSPGLLRFVTGRNGENGERSRSSRSKSYRCSKCCRRERSRLAL
jgi:hypothetical protein